MLYFKKIAYKLIYLVILVLVTNSVKFSSIDIKRLLQKITLLSIRLNNDK